MLASSARGSSTSAPLERYPCLKYSPLAGAGPTLKTNLLHGRESAFREAVDWWPPLLHQFDSIIRLRRKQREGISSPRQTSVLDQWQLDVPRHACTLLHGGNWHTEAWNLPSLSLTQHQGQVVRGLESLDVTLTWLQSWNFLAIANARQAILRRLANHLAAWFGAIQRCLTLPLTVRLRTDIPARLLIRIALHLTHGFAARSLALGTIRLRANTLRANHCAVWLLAFHVATFGVEAFATRLALRRLAYGSTHLVALGRRALPGTLGGATVVLRLVDNRWMWCWCCRSC